MKVGGESCNDEGGGGVDLHGLAPWAMIRTIENGEKDFGIFGGIASEERVCLYAAESQILRVNFKIVQ